MLLTDVADRLDALADQLAACVPLAPGKAKRNREIRAQLRELAGELRPEPHPFNRTVTQDGAESCRECGRPRLAPCHQGYLQLPAAVDPRPDWPVWDTPAGVMPRPMDAAASARLAATAAAASEGAAILPFTPRTSTDGDGLRRQAAHERQLDRMDNHPDAVADARWMRRHAPLDGVS